MHSRAISITAEGMNRTSSTANKSRTVSSKTSILMKKILTLYRFKLGHISQTASILQGEIQGEIYRLTSLSNKITFEKNIAFAWALDVTFLNNNITGFCVLVMNGIVQLYF